jgi:hypothetical protein
MNVTIAVIAGFTAGLLLSLIVIVLAAITAESLANRERR